MKKLLFILSAVVFLFSACQKEEVSTLQTTTESGYHKATGDCAETFTTPMIAGGGKYDENCSGIEVGTITVTRTELENGECKFDVSYDITMTGWMIDETHLYIGLEDGIPATGGKKKNPKIGHFEFNDSHNPAVLTYTYSKTLPCDDDNVIAAHAGVIGNFDGDLDEFCASLPTTATLVPESGQPVSYISATLTDAGWLNGVYEGWCIDEEHGLQPGDTYAGSKVYCTLNGDADGLVYEPQNFDNLNWLLNQGFVGQISDCDGQPFTVLDVQYAIWYLMDDYVPPVEDQNCRQTELEQLALTLGDGYEPGCGDYYAVALNPSYLDASGALVERQRIVVAVPLVCGDETAWGYGYCETCSSVGDCHDDVEGYAEGISFTESDYYGGNAWGWYFYGCQPVVAP